ncbi:MAG: hypothetical protein GY832_41770 [Chloroflexi bacterium]|nr:hypothetical protein [Chloroflexota bacterium]
MRSHVLLSLVALFVLAQSLCCCPLVGGPQPPYAITPSDEAVQRFKDRWGTVVKDSLDNTFAITVTEEEITSLAAQMLDKRQDLPPVSDLQVYFRNSRIEAYATVAVNDSLSLPGMVAFSPVVTDGKITVVLEEISFGPLPIPDSVLETATNALDDLVAESVMTELGYATITDIQIGDGEMILTGTISADQP